MDKEKETLSSGKREYAGLAGYCSRLAGDSLCRCGGNLKGRYCLWTHYPLPPNVAISAGDELTAAGKNAKGGAVTKITRKCDANH